MTQQTKDDRSVQYPETSLKVNLELGIGHKVALARVILFLGLVALMTTVFNQTKLYKLYRPWLVYGGAIAGGYCLLNTKAKINQRDFNRFKEQEEKILTDAEKLQKAKEDLAKQQKQDRDEYAELRKQIAVERQKIEETAQKWIDQTVEQANQSIAETKAMCDDRVEILQRQVAALNAIKYFSVGSGSAGRIGDKIINILLDFEILTDAHEAVIYPDGEIAIWLTLRTGQKYKSVKELSVELQLRLGIAEEPSIGIEKEYIAIRFQDVAVSPASISRKEAKKANEVKTPDEWFVRAIQISNHYFIAGETGAGKTVLVSNLIQVAQKELDQGDGVDIVVIDPKYPMDTWIVNGKKHRPQYICFDPQIIDGKRYPTSYEGISAMTKEIKDRQDAAVAAEMKGLPLPKRKPIIFIVDEVPSLIDMADKEQKKQTVKDILFCARFARSLGVKVVILGQDPSCKAYGFPTTATLRNFTSMWLKSFAVKGVEEFALTSEEKSRLKSLLDKQANKATKSVADSYYGIIKFSGQPPFIGKLPKEGAFLEPTEIVAVTDPDTGEVLNAEQVYDLEILDTINVDYTEDLMDDETEGDDSDDLEELVSRAVHKKRS